MLCIRQQIDGDIKRAAVRATSQLQIAAID
jgi:hypothetical protein